ncbi:MAG: hypothetical protein N4A49_16375 [Marinifilaceae bacterium]|nr:hypothetical protein [Marinifilaceae bacterium]
MKKVILLIIFFSIYFIPKNFAQSNKSTSQVAYQLFRDAKYKEAAYVFNELYYVTKSRSYFNYYIESLCRAKEYSLAIRQLKKDLKKNKSSYSSLIAMAYVYQRWGKISEAETIYTKVISEFPPIQSIVRNIATEFANRRLFEYQLKTYERAKTIVKGKTYNFEIANSYLYQKIYDKMMDYYILSIDDSTDSFSKIRSKLNYAFSGDIDDSLFEVVENKLIEAERLSEKPDIVKDLLYWLYEYKSKFEKAFSIANSISLIKKDDGWIFIKLANSAKSKYKWDWAERAYKKVLSLEYTKKYYMKAKTELLKIKFNQLALKRDLNADSIRKLSQDYKLLIDSIKTDKTKTELILNYSNILAFYLNDYDNSKKIIDEHIKSGIRLNYTERANLKLAKVDIVLLSGNYWESILLFSQIEKENRNNKFGDIAKYKKAMVSYYMGEIKWAKAQFDALKQSTSKMLANDAVEKSILISDHSSTESSFKVLQIYSKAEYLLFSKKYIESISILDSLLDNYSGHSIEHNVYWLKAQIYLQQSKYEKLGVELDKIIGSKIDSYLKPKAILLKAEIMERQEYTQDAILLYELLVKKYEQSIYTINAIDKLEEYRKNKK